MTKYKAKTYHPFVEKVQVERETPNSIWVDGQRRAKMASDVGYFDSFDRAKGFLLAIAKEKVKVANYRLKQAKAFIGNVKGLKE